MITAANTTAMVIGYLSLATSIGFVVWVSWWEIRECLSRARRRRKALEMWEYPTE